MEHDEHLTATAFDETAVPELGADGTALPERRCILTGAHGVRDELIRFAVGPDGSVAADLSAKLPGRGAWVVADREVVTTAMAKGKLKGAFARAFKSNALKLSDDLPDQISAGLERRALDRLGLENKAGNLIWGHERIGEALLKGKVRLLLHAGDAKADGMGKLEARRRGASPDTVSIILPVGRDRLSMALGRENVVHAAITDAASASRTLAALGRWAAWNGVSTDSGASDKDDEHDELDAPAIADAAAERH
jgi:predicted RNA-binding protein YlxR (DUF448 family)